MSLSFLLYLGHLCDYKVNKYYPYIFIPVINKIAEEDVIEDLTLG